MLIRLSIILRICSLSTTADMFPTLRFDSYCVYLTHLLCRILYIFISSEVSMSELLVIASKWPGDDCRTAWDESPLRIEPDNLSAHVSR